MTITNSQRYGGSAQQASDSRESYRLREKAINNGFTIREEKRGKENVIIIVINSIKKAG